MFEEIKKRNLDFPIYHVEDEKFKEYGQIIHGIDCQQLLNELKKRPIPEEGNYYVASDPELESLSVAEIFQREIYGGLPIQIGYCNGNGFKLNALEYHKCPELNISSEDIILFLGKTAKIVEDQYSSAEVEAFYLPKDVLIELDGTTMHFAPCKTTNKGFKTIVVLPKGTNEDFSPDQLASIKSKTLFKTSKWLLAHSENEQMIQRGAYKGLHGVNYQVNQVMPT